MPIVPKRKLSRGELYDLEQRISREKKRMKNYRKPVKPRGKERPFN